MMTTITNTTREIGDEEETTDDATITTKNAIIEEATARGSL